MFELAVELLITFVLFALFGGFSLADIVFVVAIIALVCLMSSIVSLVVFSCVTEFSIDRGVDNLFSLSLCLDDSRKYRRRRSFAGLVFCRKESERKKLVFTLNYMP